MVAIVKWRHDMLVGPALSLRPLVPTDKESRIGENGSLLAGK